MQAEGTGNLKQHLNNALPPQNSTTTRVSVILNAALDKEGQICSKHAGQRPTRDGAHLSISSLRPGIPVCGAAALAPDTPESPPLPAPPRAGSTQGPGVFTVTDPQGLRLPVLTAGRWLWAPMGSVLSAWGGICSVRFGDIFGAACFQWPDFPFNGCFTASPGECATFSQPLMHFNRNTLDEPRPFFPLFK